MSTHLIDGTWTDGAATAHFQAFDPARNCPLPRQFAQGSSAEVDAAAQAAAAAAAEYAATPANTRAEFLRAIAANMEARQDALSTAAQQETALPPPRLAGECARTVGQLRMFADFIDAGRHLDARHDAALPAREPLPRPDLRLMQYPLGVVAVFGASNFPLAFSVAGGDTAAALAAGCPVIVKGHPAHPHTSEIVARAIAKAAEDCSLPAGVFALVQGSTPALSLALVQHPIVSAVGFTGSLRAGRALFDAACQRPSPIPFYAEMGSINPVFVLSDAAKDAATIAAGWAGSLLLGGGQFCTNPGVLFCPAAQVEVFTQAAQAAVEKSPVHTMLTPGIAAAYRDALAKVDSYVHWQGAAGEGCAVAAALLRCDVAQWLADVRLQEEVFAPLGVIVSYEEDSQLTAAVQALAGQLTATLWLADTDHDCARRLLPGLTQKAGRVLCNGFPTGVEVADAMMHGGPYPAATVPTTSVGSLSIRRFLRPVCHQNFPPALLPPPLQ